MKMWLIQNSGKHDDLALFHSGEGDGGSGGGGGGGGSVGDRIYNQTPTGSVNGVNTTFVVSENFEASTVVVNSNGVRLKPTTNYTISLPKSVVFIVPPSPGDQILIDFNKVGTGGERVYNETPAGVINGSNSTFTTAFNFINATVEVYLNGVRLKAGSAYTLSGANQIIFFSAPQIGDQILVDYTKV